MCKTFIRHLIINIFTSGKYFQNKELHSSDYFIRYVLMNFFSFIFLSIFIFYGIESILDQNFFESCLYIMLAIIVIFSIIIARTNFPLIIPGIITFLFYGLLNVVTLWVGYTYGSILLYIFPLLSIMIIGLKAGSFLSFFMLLATCFFTFFSGISKIQYDLNHAVQILLNYILVLSIAFLFEYTRISKDKVISRQKTILENQKQDLRRLNDNLQDIVDEKTKKVVKLQNSILKTMSDLVEYRDYVTGEHVERTQHGVNLLLEEMKKRALFAEMINEWDISLILQSAQLHDIGKIAVSDTILKKPGPLTEDEYAEMKDHVVFGFKIIERIEADSGENELLNHAKIFALTHHEKWDGTGYPNGLQGEKIPLQGRIMAIADVYDALVSERPYKKAFTHEDAVRIIMNGKGTQFDPILIDLFASMCNKL